MGNCSYTMPSGNSCKGYQIKNSQYCFRHSLNNKRRQIEASRAGGQNRALRGIYGQEVVLQTPQNIKVFLGTVINAVWTGQVPVPVGSSMGFLTRCWLDAHEASNVEDKVDKIEDKILKQELESALIKAYGESA